ncbi:MAG: ABC transporter substrate-binding protein, partial [Pseudomonadota bacterium]
MNIRAAASIAAAVCLILASHGRAASETLIGQPPMTLASFGGAFTKANMLTLVRPFRSATGRWVNVEDNSGGLDEIRDQVQSLNVKWDVVVLQLPEAIRGCDEGLLERIDSWNLPPAPDGTPAVEDFYPQAIQRCAVGLDVFATVVAYNPDLF